jgi:hypothetical protein
MLPWIAIALSCQEVPLYFETTLKTDGSRSPTEADPETDTGASDSEVEDSSLRFEAGWNGEDGFTVEWSPADRYTHVVLEAADGETVGETDSTTGSAFFSGLEEGEYLLTLHEDAGAPAAAQVGQLVGSNRLLYRSELPLGFAMDVWGQDNIALLAGGKNPDIGLLVADVSSPEVPAILTELNGIGYVRDVKSADGLLFTAVDADSDGCEQCDDIGIRIFDFSDPAAPVLLSTIGEPAHSVHNMTYSDGFLYVCSMFEQNLVIFDLEDPTDPKRVATWAPSSVTQPPQLLPTLGGPHDATAVGDRLYVAHAFGFSILDISDPYSPVELGSRSVQMGTHNVWPNETGDLLVASQEIAGGPMTLWDISDMENIQELYSLATGDDRCIHNAYFKGETIFAAWYIDGVFVFEPGDDGLPEERGHYDTYDGPITLAEGPNGEVLPPISGAWGVWPYGKHLLVGDTMRGLIVLDYIPHFVVGEALGD